MVNMHGELGMHSGTYDALGNSDFVTVESIICGYFVILLICGAILIIVGTVKRVLKKQYSFSYPYFQHKFDITGKRKTDVNELVRSFIADESNWNDICEHQRIVDEWKRNQYAYAESIEKEKKRDKTFAALERTIDDEHEYRFIAVRNYRRYNDYTEQVDSEIYMSFDQLEHMRESSPSLVQPADTRSVSAEHRARQRQLMTPELRRQIAERDNYTCQKCGRYMPDGFGLEIDHIVPVSKGGETVPWNLQVLCYKCNAEKGAKIEQ